MVWINQNPLYLFRQVLLHFISWKNALKNPLSKNLFGFFLNCFFLLSLFSLFLLLLSFFKIMVFASSFSCALAVFPSQNLLVYIYTHHVSGIGHMKQILSRMFPFKRGLIHSLWAPNFWALYAFADRIFNFLCICLVFWCESCIVRVLGLSFAVNRGTSKTAETELLILPNIPPWVSLLLTVGFSIPLWIKILKNKNPHNFLHFCADSSLIFFFFGFHVHEKAALMPLCLYQYTSFLLFHNSQDWTPILILQNHFTLFLCPLRLGFPYFLFFGQVKVNKLFLFLLICFYSRLLLQSSPLFHLPFVLFRIYL